MFGEKSQSSLIIIVGIISVVAILWIFIIYKQANDTKLFLKNIKISKIQEYLEMFKGYSKNSLILSVHKSTIQIAQKGGNTKSIRSWICTEPVYPKVNEMRYFLSDSTKKIYNPYLLKANKSKQMEDITIIIDPSTCIDYDVKDSNVMDRKNDEKFNVGAYGSHIYINYDFDSANSTNSIYEEIEKDRFWYMYRIFREWSEENTLKKYICRDCMKLICKCDTPGKCGETCIELDKCINASLDKALNDLKTKFDKYVSCNYNRNCCYQEKQSCGDVIGCKSWDDPPECNKCNLEPSGNLCINGELKFSPIKKSYYYKEYEILKMSNPTDEEDECSDKKVEMWNTVKATTEAVFSCIDKKYVLSSPEKYIKFNVHVRMSLQSRQCYSQGDCTCEWSCKIDPTTGKCEDGSEPKCQKCVPKELVGHWCTECRKINTNTGSEPPQGSTPNQGNQPSTIQTSNIQWSYPIYSGSFQEIFDQIKSELGLNVNLYDDCVGIPDWAWCWVTSGCNGFGVYCKFNVLQSLSEDKLNKLFRHELAHVIQSQFSCYSAAQSEWGADFYAGSNYYNLKLSDSSCMKATEIAALLLQKGCSEEDIKDGAFCKISALEKCSYIKQIDFC
ncbi:MAG: hypothetical protein QW350_02230 [Candidatus Aenigmatarchaeota archaeon]